MNQSKMMRVAIIGFIALMGFLTLTNTTFLTVDPGQKGVLFKRFSGGLEKDKLFDQGFHVVAPWNKMYIYDVRIKEGSDRQEVLSKNGLNIAVELSYLYNPEPSKIGYLHDEVGPDYLNRILIPEVRSATREVIGKYLPEELYSTQREAIQDEIFQQTKDAVASKHIHLDAILIREVELPNTLEEAIERKLREEQASLEYQFKLDRERQEAERKIIAANADAEANRIISSSLTDKILKDKGINATLTLAQSSNAKVVVVGSGKDGLPLILNNN
ncbi:MAG: prohibitin family protein [Saprospiraceae bacterium]|nr:prohibitin family protein [Saprospiraceae bacterium]